MSVQILFCLLVTDIIVKTLNGEAVQENVGTCGFPKPYSYDARPTPGEGGVYEIGINVEGEYQAIYNGKSINNMRGRINAHMIGNDKQDIGDFLSNLPKKTLKEQVRVSWKPGPENERSTLMCNKERQGRRPVFNKNNREGNYGYSYKEINQKTETSNKYNKDTKHSSSPTKRNMRTSHANHHNTHSKHRMTQSKQYETHSKPTKTHTKHQSTHSNQHSTQSKQQKTHTKHPASNPKPTKTQTTHTKPVKTHTVRHTSHKTNTRSGRSRR